MQSQKSKFGGESFAFESNMKQWGIRETQMHKMPLQYNERNLVKRIDMPNQLSAVEKAILAEAVAIEKQNY